ncbi:catalase [Tenuibacillus multivorans]|uniref:Catalase n=1 Tax=Tenuibacillus multivorans TaxID=237069 RepID=A0A1H0CIB0_9BACI|nr:catalase [Tenuibacillus multivorans]GEL76288.1 catalase-2 [Tenuibacillus multivorans]SDN57511.1 catalase [Tenuibacillus multivorans]
MDNRENEQTEKDRQLEDARVDHEGKKLTTNQGMKVSNTSESLKAGERGPTIMEDFHFREKMTHFDNERIPERVVHARGFGAHGYFQVYEPLTDLTKASFLQDPSVKTPVFVRFSTVVGSRGSADTVRDVRGFATKFYTDAGNFDLVANNMPVFFIQDAIKFPDVVHAIKPEPDNDIPQATAAHDTFWDWTTNNQETAHMIMWLLSDRALPRSFRMMEGFGVHTFRLVNDQGKARFVKFHWKPKLGVHSLVWDEVQKIAGKNPDFNRQDLWDAINNGDYPEFELGLQIIEEEQEFDFDFDILDSTKIWPEEQVPVRIVGKMTLNKNQDNFFTETEQAAFHMGNIVPGIDFTNDPLLQGRLFSYIDTQLIRLGGPNFHELPINRPIVPIHNNQREGYHRMQIDKGKVSYFANSMRNNFPMPTSWDEGGFEHYQEKVDGRKIRNRSESFNDHFSQATLFWNSMSTSEKSHIIKAFHFEVGNVKDKKIRQRVVNMFNHVDGTLAREIAKGIGVEPPAKKETPKITTTSPALSQENTVKTPQTRKVMILIDEGFSYNELKQVKVAFQKQGIHTEIVSKTLSTVTSMEGDQIEPDKYYANTHSVLYDALYIPSGQHIEMITSHKEALDFVNDAYAHAKPIGATNNALQLLSKTLVNNIAYTNDHNGQVYSNLGVVTVNETNDLTDFNEAFIEAIAQHRHWARENHDRKQA